MLLGMTAVVRNGSDSAVGRETRFSATPRKILPGGFQLNL
jgi:hypothetical protein